MEIIELAPAPAAPSKDKQQELSWKELPSIQQLLDVICSILVEEYVMTVRKKPGVFREIASSPSAPRNDASLARNDASTVHNYGLVRR